MIRNLCDGVCGAAAFSQPSHLPIATTDTGSPGRHRTITGARSAGIPEETDDGRLPTVHGKVRSHPRGRAGVVRTSPGAATRAAAQAGGGVAAGHAGKSFPGVYAATGFLGEVTDWKPAVSRRRSSSEGRTVPREVNHDGDMRMVRPDAEARHRTGVAWDLRRLLATIRSPSSAPPTPQPDGGPLRDTRRHAQR